MFQGEYCSRNDEAERADGEGYSVAQHDAEGGSHGRDPPDREEHALLAGAIVERHEYAERDSRERQEEQQKPDNH